MDCGRPEGGGGELAEEGEGLRYRLAVAEQSGMESTAQGAPSVTAETPYVARGVRDVRGPRHKVEDGLPLALHT